MRKHCIEANSDLDLIICLKMLEGLQLECSAIPLIMVDNERNQISYSIDIQTEISDKEFEKVKYLYKCLISK